MNDMVERSVFGQTITKSVYTNGKEMLDLLTDCFMDAIIQFEAVKNKKFIVNEKQE